MKYLLTIFILFNSICCAQEQYSFEQDLYNRINILRFNRGEPSVELDPFLSKQAENHSIALQEMEDLNHFGFAERLKIIGDELNLGRVAENVCVCKNAAHAIDLFFKSKEHKKSILGDFDYVGIGVNPDDYAEKYYVTIILGKDRNLTGLIPVDPEDYEKLPNFERIKQ